MWYSTKLYPSGVVDVAYGKTDRIGVLLMKEDHIFTNKQIENTYQYILIIIKTPH